jgi:hypothetical protein
MEVLSEALPHYFKLLKHFKILFFFQLNESYNIFGFRFALLGTINYKLVSLNVIKLFCP